MKSISYLLAGFILCVVSVSGCTLEPQITSEIPYFEDFEDGAELEWSSSKTMTTPVGERRFLGTFVNDTVTLTLNNLPPHSTVSVSLDLFIIRSWDGNADRTEGPDIWQLSAMGEDVLLRTTFDNHDIPEYEDHRQSFPEAYGADYPPETGAAETDTLGYTWNFTGVGSLPADAVYHLNFDFDHDLDILTLEFSAENLLSRFNNECWGIDNVQVDID